MAVSGVSYVEGLDSGEQDYTHVVATLTSAGSTVIYTPQSGRSLQLRWIYAINDPASSTSPLIQVFLGAQEKYRVYAISKRQLITGPLNGALSITLSGTGNVAVTVLLQEIVNV
jgi:hypothetical protein